MGEPISAVVKVANTPAQAKIYVAMLEAEGIPAFVDGDSAADEFAMSQRMLNVINVRVLVPTDTLSRARAILEPSEVRIDDLTRQALEAMDDPEAERET